MTFPIARSPEGTTSSGVERRPIRTNLDPVRKAVDSLNPPPANRRIQVVGSNGKGSVVLALSRCLLRSGKRTVSFLSPHLHHPRERYLLDSVPISRQWIDVLLEEERQRHPDFTPFEIYTIVAYRLADRLDPDYLLLEAGMGGRWDATSALPARWILHTGVEREHTDYLGEDRRSILREQLVQMPEGATLLTTGSFDEECRSVVDELIAERGGRLRLESSKEGEEPSVLVRAIAEELEVQPHAEARLPRLPGRLEQRFLGIDRSPVLFDVAHTPRAARRLINLVNGSEDHPDPEVLVYGGNRDKDHRSITSILERGFAPERWILPALPDARFTSPEELSLPTRATVSRVEPSRLLDGVRSASGPVLVTGGFSVVRFVREQLGVAS